MKNEIEIINQRDVELLEKTRKINLQKLFTEEGMNEIISAIKAEVKDFKADIATKEGRAEIVSMAFKIAKCKAPIKNLASELKEDSRKLIEGVNSHLNRYEKEMDTLRDEIRKPVDEIEEKIEKHKQESLSKIDKMQKLAFSGLTANDIDQAMIEVRQIFVNFDFGEFTFKAENDKNTSINHLKERLEIALKAEADARELKKLKEEKEEREKKDREEQIAREAVEKARIEAEKREKKLEQEKIDAEEEALILKRKNEMFNIGLTQDIIADFDVANKIRFTAELICLSTELVWQENLLEIKKEIEKVVEKRRLENEKEKKRIENEAIENERNRVESEKRKEAEALEKREANKKHRNKINHEIHVCLKKVLTSKFEVESQDSDQAIDDIIEAIARGEVPHVQINY